jgi:hypothetical protein
MSAIQVPACPRARAGTVPVAIYTRHLPAVYPPITRHLPPHGMHPQRTADGACSAFDTIAPRTTVFISGERHVVHPSAMRSMSYPSRFRSKRDPG